MWLSEAMQFYVDLLWDKCILQLYVSDFTLGGHLELWGMGKR